MPDIYLHQDGNQTGPFQPDQVRQLLAQGKVSADTPAWHEGMGEWGTAAALVPPVVPPTPHSSPPPVLASMVAPPPIPAPLKHEKGMSGLRLAVIIVACVFGGIFVLSCLAGIAIGPISMGVLKAKENKSMQRTRQIELAMVAYANDNNGIFPEGKTSTEVFQKLIDGNYVADPSVFYLAMIGKTKPASNKLTADNVCYDVTSGVVANSSGNVPLVFSTGYTVTYSAGGGAIRDPGAQIPFPGIAVAYKDSSANFWISHPDGTVPQIIPSAIDLGANNYQQLRP